MSKSASAVPTGRPRGGSLLRRLSVRDLVLLLAGAAVAALVIVAVVSELGAHTVTSHTNQAATASAQERLVNQAEQAWLTDDDQSNMYTSLIALREPSQAALANTTWAQAVAGYETAEGALGSLGEVSGDPPLHTLVARASAALATYHGYSQRVRSSAAGGDVQQAVWLMSVGNASVSNRLAGDLSSLEALVHRRMAEALAGVRSTSASSATTVLIVGLIALLALVGVAFVTVRTLVTRLRQGIDRIAEMEHAVRSTLGPALEALAVGDLTRHLTATTVEIVDFPAGEVGRMLHAGEALREGLLRCYDAYNRGTEGLRDMILNVCRTSGTVARSSQDMFRSAEETSRAAEEVAGAIGDVARGAESQVTMIDRVRQLTQEVAAAVTEAAQSASSTADAAAGTRSLADAGVASAGEASQAMEAVHRSSEAVSGATDKLVTMSNQIGQIVETITAIAQQTNLLALNAAIEAARAGEHGHGFAVVADEVRQLAEESQSAAREISQLIGSIQEETKQVLSVVRTSSEQTSAGVTVVEQTRQAFTDIGVSVADITVQVEQIATLAGRVDENVRNLHQTIDDIAAVAEESSAATEEVSASTEQTSASAQEITASAEQVAGSAEQLRSLIGTFHFRD